MGQKHVLTALAIFAVTGAVNHSQNLAEAWQGDVIRNLNGMITKAAKVDDYRHKDRLSSSQRDRSLSFPKPWIARYSVDRGQSEGESLIHKVGADAYSGMGVSGADAARSQQGPIPGDQSRRTGEYTYGSPSNESRYGTNPSDNYLKKESSGSPTPPFSTTPYSDTIYGGLPTTPSADPMIKELSR